MAKKINKRLTDAKVQETVFLAQEMFENYEKKVLDLSNQLKFVRIINSTLDIEEMVNAILFSCQGNILVSGVSIFLPADLDTTAYSFRACVGYEREKFDITLPANSQLMKLLQKSKSYISYSSIANKEKFKRISLNLAQLHPELLVPLKVKDTLNGFLVFGQKLSGKDFTNSEYAFISFIAEAASIAVDNARLYQMATLDRMSNLYVHHYFKNQLHTEFLRAKRYKKPLSLLMLDIDHFKNVNDTYGHQKGDLVIKDIAKIIRAGIREIDIAARYGGEEFAVIFPETGIESSITVAERLRETIEKHHFISHKAPVHITSSFGIACIRKDVTSPSQLLEMADQALYRSKENGRNQVSRA